MPHIDDTDTIYSKKIRMTSASKFSLVRAWRGIALSDTFKSRWAKRRVEFYVERGRCANLFIGPFFLLAIGVDLSYRSAYISFARDKRYTLQLWPRLNWEVWE